MYTQVTCTFIVLLTPVAKSFPNLLEATHDTESLLVLLSPLKKHALSEIVEDKEAIIIHVTHHMTLVHNNHVEEYFTLIIVQNNH